MCVACPGQSIEAEHPLNQIEEAISENQEKVPLDLYCRLRTGLGHSNRGYPKHGYSVWASVANGAISLLFCLPFVYYNLDYGYKVYSFAAETLLQLLNSICDTHICLTPGTLPTSYVNSLLCNAGEWPLNPRQDHAIASLRAAPPKFAESCHFAQDLGGSYAKKDMSRNPSGYCQDTPLRFLRKSQADSSFSFVRRATLEDFFYTFVSTPLHRALLHIRVHIARTFQILSGVMFERYQSTPTCPSLIAMQAGFLYV